MKRIAISQFRARCLAVIDEVHRTRRPIAITKQGRAIATLQPAEECDETDEKPWLRLRGTIRWYDDPFKPAVAPSEWDALKPRTVRKSK